MPHSFTHYDLLEVSRTASPEVIRAAYRSLIQSCHPDRNPTETENCNARVQDLNAAYAVLSDPQKRSRYDRLLERGEDAYPPSPVPITGWGLVFEGRWLRVVRGWVEYALVNDTPQHAWVVLFTERGVPIRSVFVRSGETAHAVVSARRTGFTVSFGRQWDGAMQGFDPEEAWWRLRTPVTPPGPEMRLDVSFRCFAQHDRFEQLPGRAAGHSALRSPPPTLAPVTPRPSLLLLATLCLVGLMVWGTFVRGPLESVVGAGVLGTLCGVWLFRHLVQTGERIPAAAVATVVGAGLWATLGWFGLSHALAAVGWRWGPSPTTALLWASASLGPPALAWGAWASLQAHRPRVPGLWLTFFAATAFAGMWGSVFGWEGGRWGESTVSAGASAIAATVLSVGLAWAAAAEATAVVLRAVLTFFWGHRTRKWYAGSFRLLAAWALLPLIAMAVTPVLPSGLWGWMLTAWNRLIEGA